VSLPAAARQWSPAGALAPARPEPVSELLPSNPGAFDHLFDLARIAAELGKPDGAHHVLSEVHEAAQSAPAQVAEQLLALHHFLGRHLAVVKAPPVDLRQTVLQLASQEPAASRVARTAEATLRAAHQGGRNLIEWTNKHPAVPLPCVMDIREHSDAVYAVAVSPDGKLVASGSADKTVVVVEAATGRVRWRLRGHRCHVCSIFV
jgi:hypothetical protein